MIVASCGHVLTDEDNDGHGWNIGIKAVNRRFEPCVEVMNVCTACRDEYVSDGVVLSAEGVYIP